MSGNAGTPLTPGAGEVMVLSLASGACPWRPCGPCDGPRLATEQVSGHHRNMVIRLPLTAGEYPAGQWRSLDLIAVFIVQRRSLVEVVGVILISPHHLEPGHRQLRASVQRCGGTTASARNSVPWMVVVPTAS